MTTAIATQHQPLPKDARTGLTLPLSKSLGLQDLAKHRALVAFELEVLAEKVDRFGWKRDRGSAAQDRIILDWMNALQEFPLDEVRAACAAAVLARPDKMPNEGHVVAQINEARRAFLVLNPPRKEPELERKPVDKAAAAEIMARAGFAVKSFGGAA